MASGDFKKWRFYAERGKTGEPPGTVHDQNLFLEQKCNVTKQNICSSSPSLEALCMNSSWERSGQEPSPWKGSESSFRKMGGINSSLVVEEACERERMKEAIELQAAGRPRHL